MIEKILTVTWAHVASSEATFLGTHVKAWHKHNLKHPSTRTFAQLAAEDFKELVQPRRSISLLWPASCKRR